MKQIVCTKKNKQKQNKQKQKQQKTTTKPTKKKKKNKKKQTKKTSQTALLSGILIFWVELYALPVGTAMSNLTSKLGQIGPKWDKSGTF